MKVKTEAKNRITLEEYIDLYRRENPRDLTILILENKLCHVDWPDECRAA